MDGMSIVAKYAAGVVLLASAATVIAQAGVNLLKLGGLTITWLYPVLALVFGVVASLLLLVASETALTNAELATAVLAGVLAALGAVGVTELGRAADATKENRSREKAAQKADKSPPAA